MTQPLSLSNTHRTKAAAVRQLPPLYADETDGGFGEKLTVDGGHYACGRIGGAL